MEQKIIWKWFWAWEFEKEERWLNEMAQAGWVLDKIGFARYTFIKAEPGAYTLRLAFQQDASAYIAFLEGMGAEYIGGIANWRYFRMKTELGQFDLFSDIDSRIAHLNRIGKVLLCLGIANLCIGIGNSLSVAHIGWINLLVATLLMYGLGRIHGKKEALEQERLLHE